MKSKTLLIAAATLAAGVMSSQAAVYSQNIVGYVNVTIKGNGDYNLLANPLDDGQGNYLTNLINTTALNLPKQSQCLTWNPAGGYFTVGAGGTPVAWPVGTGTQLPPGVGFFIRNGTIGGGAPDVTNTFVGTVVVPSGGLATNQIAAGYGMYGTIIPVSGNIAYATTTGGDTNINYGAAATVKRSQILTFSPTGGFTTIGLGGSTAPYVWASTVPVSVGQGFFINNLGVATNVVENAQY